jgi:mono/diheme cytochrome c family protein
MTRILTCAILWSMVATAAAAQTGPRRAPPLTLPSLTGRQAFDNYCATCHGADGRGRGPMAASLRTPPADLTTLARRAGGTFPREQVMAYVDGSGRALPSHGPAEMPLWGGIFRWLDSEASTRARLATLVAYVASLQAVDAAPAPARSGAELYRTHCASCHGADGRGGGPIASQLKREPPDLTRFQMINGGAFPAARLRRIIDGREVAAHGDRTMPVWGDVFRHAPDGGRDAATARVDALLEFIRSIQERSAE